MQISLWFYIPPLCNTFMNRREPLNGSSSSDERYNEASPAQDLQPYPSERVLGDLGLGDVHLNREVDGEWIERGCPNQAQEVVEEWEYHGDHGSRLDEAEYWLAKNLETENPDEMDGDADVGEVDQPKGLVEAETGEEVSGSIVSKRGVAKATT
nr:Os06g0556101 [Ipomoea batatas]